jgi:hypothetical protein
LVGAFRGDGWRRYIFLEFTWSCTHIVFIDIPRTQDAVSADIPNGMVKSFLVGVVAKVARALKCEVEILAGTDA